LVAETLAGSLPHSELGVQLWKERGELIERGRYTLGT
jgi:hypothetical protein